MQNLVFILDDSDIELLQLQMHTILDRPPLPQPTLTIHDRARTALSVYTESFCICVTAEEEQHHLRQKFFRNVGGGGRFTGDVCCNATLSWAVWGGGEQGGHNTPLLSTSSQPEVEVFINYFFSPHFNSAFNMRTLGEMRWICMLRLWLLRLLIQFKNYEYVYEEFNKCCGTE